MVAQLVKNPPAKRETWIRSLGWEDPLEEGMASHSSILAWRLPWAEEPGGLRSTGSQSVWTTEWLSTAEYSVSPWRTLPAPPLPVSSFALVCMLTQPCPTFWDPMDGSPPGSSVHGIFPGKNTRVSCHFLLQGTFPIQGSNPGLLCLLHWQAESLPLSHQGSPWFTPLVLGTYSLVVSEGCLEVSPFSRSLLKMPLWCRIWNYFQTADSCPMWIWHLMPFWLWKCGIKPVFIYLLSFFNALSGS